MANATAQSGALAQARLADPKAHSRQLIANAAAALSRGDLETALLLSDRACRLPMRRNTGPLLLRAEASLRLGLRDLALADVATALTIDPEDAEALNRRLAWSTDDDAKEAARQVLRRPSASPAVSKALSALKGEVVAAAAGRSVAGAVTGWAAWSGEPSIALHCGAAGMGNPATFTIHADPAHPLSGALGNAANFELAVEASAGLYSGVETAAGDGLRISATLGPRPEPQALPKPAAAADRVGALTPIPPRHPRLTVIVPVYLDEEATRRCLDALVQRAASERPYRVLIVDDATPDPAIRSLLVAYPFEVLTNAANQGFARSVNRALDEAAEGDVVLLNADAVLPPGALDRMADAAYSAGDIGTVTPLSNNGELTSAPAGFQVNPMPTPQEHLALDDSARRSAGPSVVDLPGGVGFCLFIRHDCRRAIDRLSVDYNRGYGEDTDLCLRAREAGYRSVCAADVFVAHAGTRSFRADKRSLVVRNLRRIDSQFPQHRPEVTAFQLADPLRPARAAVSAPSDVARPSTLVVATPATRRQAETRCRNLRNTRPSILAVVGADSWTIWRCEADEAPLQVGEGSDLVALLAGSDFDSIEICDPMLFQGPKLRLPAAPMSLYVCGRSAAPTAAIGVATERMIWSPALAATKRRIAADADAAAFCSAVLGIPTEFAFAAHEADAPPAPSSRLPSGAGGRLGVVALNASGIRPETLTALARRTGGSGPASRVSLVVIGVTPWDEILQASGIVHIAGKSKPEELPADITRLGVSTIWLASATPVFGHPMKMAATNLGLPLAQTSWGRRDATAGQDGSRNLALTPGQPDAALVAALAKWHEWCNLPSAVGQAPGSPA